MSIFSERYCPIFLKNLTEEEKEEFNGDIHNKIRGIKISINKSKVTKIDELTIFCTYVFKIGFIITISILL